MGQIDIFTNKLILKTQQKKCYFSVDGGSCHRCPTFYMAGPNVQFSPTIASGQNPPVLTQAAVLEWEKRRRSSYGLPVV